MDQNSDLYVAWHAMKKAVYMTASVACDWAEGMMQKPLANVWAGAVMQDDPLMIACVNFMIC